MIQLKTEVVVTSVVNKPKTIGKSSPVALHVFPNPATDYTIISYTLEESGVVKLLSQDGRVIRSENLKPDSNQYLLRTGNLPSGVYTLSLKGNNKTLTTKLVIR